MRRPVVVLLLSSYLAMSGFSQMGRNMPGETGASIRGSIELPPGGTSSTFLVLLEGAGGVAGREIAGLAGDFSFENIAPGSYTIEVSDGYGNFITDQVVTVTPGINSITITLPSISRRQKGGSTVSLAELRHKVPAKAQKEFAQAQKAWDNKDWTACLDHLKNAVAIDPQFIQAHRGMGIVYSRLRQPEKVISSFQEVLMLDPKAPAAYGYIGPAYVNLAKYDEAEVAARRALGTDSGDVRGQFVLGLILARTQKDNAEALRLLRSSENTFPDAYVMSAGILVRNGEVAQARHQLQTYLPHAAPEVREQIKAWLKAN